MSDAATQSKQIQKAYANVRQGVQDTAASCEETFAEIKVDGIDQAYVWFRTFVPSWLMGLIFLAGLTVMIPLMLKKVFGIQINLGNIIVKTKKKKEAPDA